MIDLPVRCGRGGNVVVKKTRKPVKAVKKAVKKTVKKTAKKAVKKTVREIRSKPKTIAKYVYFFGDGKAEGKGELKELLGGKGAGLAEMTNLGIPVPPGFTISTEACGEYTRRRRKYPPGLWDTVIKYMSRLEKTMQKSSPSIGFGNPSNPLLVSVRSGARASMPGMMDSVLNLGLNDQTVQGLIKKTDNERFGYDAYRRFIAMFSTIVMDVKREVFEECLHDKKTSLRCAHDIDLDASALRELIDEFKILVHRHTGRDFPQNPSEQLRMGINAIFDSWNGDRAIAYRRIYKIPDAWGTAVNIMAMVFGNMGNDSGTGVVFTRSPSSGDAMLFGEFLSNAQGEDVVAGVRTPQPITKLEATIPEAYKALTKIQRKLERHYRDMLDLEFTVQKGQLYMLQTRVGKRTGIAAVKIAVDMVKERLITKEEAVLRVEPEHIEQYLYPVFDPNTEARYAKQGKGLPAGPGAAAGKIALTPEQAITMKAAGDRVILVRMETSPDDIHGMSASSGFLTARGGMTSHAAVVARQMGKVCIAGCETVEVNGDSSVRIGSARLNRGDFISINGFDGSVYCGDIPVMASEVVQVIQGTLKPEKSERYQYFAKVLEWADMFRSLDVRANADVPDQAVVARGFGAQGIGLCRTEHMFFAEDRVEIMRSMIMARSTADRMKYLDDLLPLQKQDFIGLYQQMDGYPVTIRLFDPPLHEFLPKREDLMVQIVRAELGGEDSKKLAETKRMLARVEELHEFNPMLGLRGCRLGILMPEITRMQVRAIIEAACEVTKAGGKIFPEIMVPLIGIWGEMKTQKQVIQEVASQVMTECDRIIPYQVGTMIELPRATIMAGEIAEEAEFFSFGTNDLTQTTFGFSRDDAAKIIDFYMTMRDRCPRCQAIDIDQKTMVCRSCEFHIVERADNILTGDPFTTLDRRGVGGFIQIAIERGRAARPDLKLGICGEHGGDPSSVEFCHRAGLSYVSCSPYRVPIARLAAAQSAINHGVSASARLASLPTRRMRTVKKRGKIATRSR